MAACGTTGRKASRNTKVAAASAGAGRARTSEEAIIAGASWRSAKVATSVARSGAPSRCRALSTRHCLAREGQAELVRNPHRLAVQAEEQALRLALVAEGANVCARR